MSDILEPKDNSTPDTHGGVAFTVPEKAVDVRVTDHPAPASGGNHEKELFDVGRAFSGDSVQKGTIVSDRKRAHTGVGTMLVSAWNEWWGNTRKSLEMGIQKIESHPLVKPKEEPVLSAPQTRASVIEEAHAHGTQAPRDDHEQVKEKIRSEGAANAVPLPTFAIKPAASKTSPSWVSTQDASPAHKPVVPPPLDLRTQRVGGMQSETRPDVFPSSQAPLSRKDATLDLSGGTLSVAPLVSPEKRKVATPSLGWSHFDDVPKNAVSKNALHVPEMVQKATRETFMPPTPPEPIRIPVPLPRTPAPPLMVALASPSPVRELVVRGTPPPSTPVETSLPLQESPTPLPTKDSDERSSQSILLRIPRFVLLGIVVVIGITSGVFVALTKNTDATEATPSPRTLTPVVSPLTLREKTPLIFTQEPRALMISLATLRDGGGESHEMIELVRAEGENRDVTGAEFMSVVGESVPAPFRRTITNTYSVGILREGTAAPYIVLSSPEYERAFGGMLMWEKTMSADLSPFFGVPVTSSLAPGKDHAVPGVHFVDAILGNGAVRILYDELGNERIVYALVKDEYILITSTTDALATLTTLLK